ncbi:hypothetical protein HYU13_01780 [Candidatus Woesearchaeota archaeon]|nr:hypothetical protein [Candidatus Woesearchaeota archaeon]
MKNKQATPVENQGGCRLCLLLSRRVDDSSVLQESSFEVSAQYPDDAIKLLDQILERYQWLKSLEEKAKK